LLCSLGWSEVSEVDGLSLLFALKVVPSEQVTRHLSRSATFSFFQSFPSFPCFPRFFPFHHNLFVLLPPHLFQQSPSQGDAISGFCLCFFNYLRGFEDQQLRDKSESEDRDLRNDLFSFSRMIQTSCESTNVRGSWGNNSRQGNLKKSLML